MKKISDALREITQRNPLLQFGISHGLFNLSKLSKFLQKQIAARTQKEVQVSAITMSLSRLQRQAKKIAPQIQQFEVENILIYSDLFTMTFVKTPEVHQQIQKLYTAVQQQNGFMTLSEGGNQITIILENNFLDLTKPMITATPVYENLAVSSVGVRFAAKYLDIPGFLYIVLQQIVLQGINVVELSSTYTEFIIYIEKRNAKLAFETIFQCFSKS